MRLLRHMIGTVAVAIIATAAFAAAPAQAHNIAAWGGDGCLHRLHDNLIGSVSANSGTCSGRDNFWSGRVRDDHATSDGHCVMAVLNGIRMADSCDSAGRSFLFLDPQRNSNAPTAICWSNSSFCTVASNRNF